MTAQELFEYSNEPYRQELVDGILYEMEPPGFEHGRVALTIGARLHAHVRKHELGFAAGEVGFLLASKPDTVRAPDACFVAAARLPEAGVPVGYWPGPPDLAVEVVSPNDRRSELEGKALHWLDAGTRVVVVLDPPNKTATVYRSRHDIRILAGDEPLDLDDVVPGFAPRTGDLFG
jgi:Uma2 family endonuclease